MHNRRVSMAAVYDDGYLLRMAFSPGASDVDVDRDTKAALRLPDQPWRRSGMVRRLKMRLHFSTADHPVPVPDDIALLAASAVGCHTICAPMQGSTSS